MSVQTEINRIETAKAAIGTAIAGKGVAVPSGTKLDGMAALIDGIEAGGEDVSAETAEYTELLTDLETAIDALPDAGSGGGSGSGGTCTVKMFTTSPESFLIHQPCYIDGASNSLIISDQAIFGGEVYSEMILTDVACNSLIVVNCLSGGMDYGPSLICNGCELAAKSNFDDAITIFINASPGETATVEFTYEE